MQLSEIELSLAEKLGFQIPVFELLKRESNSPIIQYPFLALLI